ncbi:MAG: ribonuclease H-like domain-containing protein [Candidatus Dormibacteria bacterium]
MVSQSLRLRLAALQGDPSFKLGPRHGTPRVPDGGSPEQVDLLGRVAQLGFVWEAERGILVRQLDVPLATLNLLPEQLAWKAIAPIGEAVPVEGPVSVLCFDLETTGLQKGAGTVPFLYGWASYRGGSDSVSLEQWLLPELGEEAPLVKSALAQISQAGLLLTYNGSSYDLPLLRARMVMAGVDRPWPATAHLDLLPVVRRLFRHRLDRCTLRVVEEDLLGQGRGHDLPGREAPERYWRFLQTGDPAPLADVVRHNQQDVLSLLSLVQRLGRHLELQEAQPSDWLSLGRFVEERGDLTAAQLAYRMAERVAPPPLDRAAGLRRARLLRRQGKTEDALQAWQALWQRWRDPEAAEAICVDLEHRQRDVAAALSLAREAMLESSVGWDQRFAKRIWRLRSRLGADPDDAEPARSFRASTSQDRPWATWLPGGESYEAWLILRRGMRTAEGIERSRSRVVARAG